MTRILEDAHTMDFPAKPFRTEILVLPHMGRVGLCAGRAPAPLLSLYLFQVVGFCLHPTTLSTDGIMLTDSGFPPPLYDSGFPPPLEDSYDETFPDGSPPYSPSTRNSSGRGSVSSRVPSTPTDNEPYCDKSSSGTLSPIYLRNEDDCVFTTRAPLYPRVNGPSSLRRELSDYTVPSLASGGAPSRPSGGFEPLQSLTQPFVRLARSDTLGGDHDAPLAS